MGIGVALDPAFNGFVGAFFLSRVSRDGRFGDDERKISWRDGDETRIGEWRAIADG